MMDEEREASIIFSNGENGRQKLTVSHMGEKDDDNGCPDMIHLQQLDEENMLKNLRKRYENELIYTYTGSILVSVNPYKLFNIYGKDKVDEYNKSALTDKPPHLFAIGNAAYERLLKDDKQVVVISGESGAGKTESAKLLMQYLASVDRHSQKDVTQQILEANPLLESFGNAKTTRNDNSSRFGKYIELAYYNCSIMGAKTTEYLLERSRIVTQSPGERNYHIFYEMLSGLSRAEKDNYGLMTAEQYFYLTQSGSCSIASKDDKKDFVELDTALKVLKFTEAEQTTIWRILAAILHLGNISFQRNQNDDRQEQIEIRRMAEVKWISHLLALSQERLTSALTSKVTIARREKMITPFNMDQALDTRDAIAKALYSGLFTWLVDKVNSMVRPNSKRCNGSIALLDIFGFEELTDNSFEQLCINYANERLHSILIYIYLKLNKLNMLEREIDWKMITFNDNQGIIDLISRKPHGIIHLLDDESNFPQGSDNLFLEKCHFQHATSKYYEKPRVSGPCFNIVHYAGKVTYNVRYFVDKNRDILRNEVIELLIRSRSRIISTMITDWKEKQLDSGKAKFRTLKPKTPTIAAGFHTSLGNLIDAMSKCHPFFVRCVKPNNDKIPMSFDTSVVLDQLRYTGMLETIRIRKEGFSVRIPFDTFIQRYHVILGYNINLNQPEI